MRLCVFASLDERIFKLRFTYFRLICRCQTSQLGTFGGVIFESTPFVYDHNSRNFSWSGDVSFWPSSRIAGHFGLALRFYVSETNVFRRYRFANGPPPGYNYVHGSPMYRGVEPSG